jgi:YggT family protein
MIRLLYFISELLHLYIYVVFAVVVVGWLIAFDVINRRNPFVQSVWSMLLAVTEPVMSPIRRMMPNLGAIDISPLILILGIGFIDQVVIGNLVDLLR